jgi:hypothetical protein
MQAKESNPLAVSSDSIKKALKQAEKAPTYLKKE